MVASCLSGLEQSCEQPVYAETKIIPSVTASESYDSNVWRSPAGLLPPGTKAWDFVTGVSPQVEVLNKSRLGDTRFNAGVFGSLFVNNQALNYISTNVAVNSDLSSWVRELIPGARLQVSDSFLFTPEPPGFVTGVKPQDPADTFARGVVAFRANTFTNYATVTGTYSFTRLVGFQATYSNSIFRVGQVFQPQTSTPSTNLQSFFFDTTVHNASVGPTYRLTRGDTLSLNYQPTYMSLSGGGSTATFASHSVVVGYSKEMPGWTVTANGGPALLEQGNLIYYNGRVTVATTYDASTRFRLTVSRQLSPAFFGTGGGLISNAVGFSIEHKFERDLLLTATANYSDNKAAPVEVANFKSLLTGVRLTYKVTRSLSASVAYDYNFFDIKSGTGLALQAFEFDRHAITFSLGTKWK